MIISIGTKNNFPKVLKIITDASESKLPESIKTDDILKIVKVNELHLAQRELLCHALIVSSPKETAFGHLYMESSKRDNYFFNVFSTKEAALNWLKSF